MTFPSKCPSCGENLKGEDIYEYFLKDTGDADKALDKASAYGWTDTNPKAFTRCIGIYCREEDEILLLECPDCKQRWEFK